MVACSPSPSPPRPQAEPAAQRTVANRTLVVVSRGEPPSLAAKSLQPYSASIGAPVRLFNAMLDFTDERDVARLYLAEAVPQLGTDTWQVSPEGGMETIYRLRPNLTWNDGEPLTAEDFA